MNDWQRRRQISGWQGKRERLVEWRRGNTVFLSVVFTWQLEKSRQRAIEAASQGYYVRAGGPAVALNPSYLADVADCSGSVDALPYHNQSATFTTRGCPRKCKFCAVPRIEGHFRELDEWEPKPIVCDNNFLASSTAHFNEVIDKLKHLDRVDFNQGLDARLLNHERATRLSELNYRCLRLAWDHTAHESSFMRAFDMLRSAGVPARKIWVYVLIGFDDTPDDALYRLRTIWGMKAWPFPMRYQPLDAKERNGHVAPGWTDYELRKMSRYWSSLRYTSKIPYDEFDPTLTRKAIEARKKNG